MFAAATLKEYDTKCIRCPEPSVGGAATLNECDTKCIRGPEPSAGGADTLSKSHRLRYAQMVYLDCDRNNDSKNDLKKFS